MPAPPAERPPAGDNPEDRHVLSAAVRGNAEVLVTFTTRDFPEESTSTYHVTAVHPDDFLLDLLGRLAVADVRRFAAEARRHL